MADDALRGLLVLIIYTVAFPVVIVVTLSAYRAGKASRWLVAGALAVLLGAQPVVVVAAAGTEVTDQTIGLVVLMFVGALAGVAWALGRQQPTRR